eukprot:TRINITY_DN36243_c0_g1_i3.p1 TRINITY_DN36243_c0_g1~~TRINITY_DN36243_c0_g1_i3.p1  ORF type:complete len:289 (+),score=44.30 TRINITY_DN36243_c0_g1_i3:118-984(+)
MSQDFRESGEHLRLGITLDGLSTLLSSKAYDLKALRQTAEWAAAFQGMVARDEETDKSLKCPWFSEACMNGYEACLASKLNVVKAGLPDFSVCELLYCRGTAAVDRAGFFLSHAQFETVNMTLDAMRTFYRHRPELRMNTPFFVDIVSVRQGVQGDFDENKVPAVIASTGCLVLLAEPCLNPEALKRLWCVYEVFCAATSSTKIQVAVASTDEVRPIADKARGEGNEVLNPLLASVKTLDVMRAEARDPADKERVQKKILEAGPAKVNAVVAGALVTAISVGLGTCPE